ncbi:MAG: D-glycero-beta-D-manno-heptose 1,7-bisphosphate 7-phosphatase [Proteobacteria bacterium]|jgi:D-glycero-D-manno-heptose 1,7-bisphosphate phosphatase|nr:D-glycero-beta-D-manno-heptose 1,7-bisphosphate 7-phosphatase [Pseudomonadota bacterium]MDA1299982.1 D-glycero-beta-D-manno-heptose 1,7-bisphosphate 7-phosphatase [Pseudomonadota bacterium]
MSKPPVVILDRDGVINFDSPDYIKSPEEWVPIPGSIEAIALLTRAGYQVFIATNQAGVGRGKFSEEALSRIHRKMQSSITAAGGQLAGILYCPHHPDDDCDCRKPKPGLLVEIGRTAGIRLDGLPFVGDSLTDLQAARAAGCEPVLVLTGKGTDTRRHEPQVQAYADLLEYVKYLLNQ